MFMLKPVQWTDYPRPLYFSGLFLAFALLKIPPVLKDPKKHWHTRLADVELWNHSAHSSVI